MSDIEKLIEKYKLTEEEHKRVLEELTSAIFSNQFPSENSSAVFIIGQPGCGKTTFINTLDDDYIIINSDDYRYLHKYSNEILSKYPIYYAKLTNFDAHLWGDELFLYAIQNGYSVLREKAPTNLSLIDTIKIIASNHKVVISVVVTGNLTSLVATRERYEKEVREKENAKLSNIETHNLCYDILSDFIRECLKINIEVNYIIFENNEYKIIPVKDDYLSLLEKYRNDSNNLTCQNFDKRINNIKRLMLERNAPQEEFNELGKIEEVYLKLTNKEEL